jgi:hypothetical protein
VTAANGLPDRLRRRLVHLPAGLLGCAVALAGSVAVGGLMRGVPGAIGAGIGVIGVAVSYVISGLAVAWADSINPQLVLPVGLATYVIKFLLLGVLLIALSGWDGAGRLPLAFGILAGVLAWTAAHLWWIVRARIPYVEVDGSS